MFPELCIVPNDDRWKQNVGAGLAGNKKEEAGTGTEDDPSFFVWRDWKKDFRESFPAGSSRRVALARIMAYEPSVILFSMNHFRHWMSS